MRLGVIQEVTPAMQLLSQVRQIKAVLGLAEPLQLLRTLLEQRSEARRVVAGVMVERGGNLDQPVEKDLLLAMRLQPHGFERLVGLEEFPVVEKVNPRGDGRVHRLMRHGPGPKCKDRTIECNRRSLVFVYPCNLCALDFRLLDFRLLFPTPESDP